MSIVKFMDQCSFCYIVLRLSVQVKLHVIESYMNNWELTVPLIVGTQSGVRIDK